MLLALLDLRNRQLPVCCMVGMIRILWLFILSFGHVIAKDVVDSRLPPPFVHIGALFTINSTIGRVAKIAIEEAVKDVNSDSTLLPRTQLNLTVQNSNCSGFIGMVEAMRFMETDIVAVIGPQSSVVAHIVSHVANELRIPLLSFASTDPTLSSLQFPFFLRTTHSDEHQMAAIAHIVQHYGWKEVTAIFVDDDYGRNGMSALDDSLTERRCRISYKMGINPRAIARTDIMDLLVKVALLESRIIILHVYPDIGFTVFSVAHYLGMMGNGYVWIATDWLSSVLDSVSPLPPETMEAMQGTLVLRQHTPDSERKRAFLSRWNKITGGSLGLHSYGLYAYDTVWLVAHALDAFFKHDGKISFSIDSKIPSYGNSSLHLEAMSIFDDGALLLSNILESNFVGLSGAIKFSSDRTLSYPVYDIVNVVGTGIRRIGYWSNYSGLSTVPPETLNTKQLNDSSASQKLYSVIWPGETLSKPRGWVFPNNGNLLKIGVPRRASFREFVSQMRDNGMVQGFCIDVFTSAVNLLPYAVPYQFIPFGNGHENPSFNELVNKIVTGDFDAVVGDIAITTNRTKIVDFTQPYISSGLVVVAPFKKLNSGPWSFLRPFTPPMWAITGAFFLIVGTVVWILEHRINDEFRGTPKRQMITILWFSFSTWFFAHRENTLSTLGRFVLIIWLFVVLIINSSYTASLTSILTVQQLYSPINGIESLRKGNEPIGYQVGSFAEYYLSEELGISKSRLHPLGTPEEYAQALKLGPKKGGVAAIVDERPYVDLFLSTQCTFKVVGTEFTKSGWGFAFPRDSPLAVDLSTAILTLAENGDLQRIHDKWLVRSSCILDNADIESNQLQLNSFYGVYLICGLACGLALAIYFLKIIRKLCSIPPDDSILNGSGNSSSRHLKRFLSLLDEKKETSKSMKKRKVEKSLSENDTDNESWTRRKVNHSVSFEDDINPIN